MECKRNEKLPDRSSFFVHSSFLTASFTLHSFLSFIVTKHKEMNETKDEGKEKERREPYEINKTKDFN